MKNFALMFKVMQYIPIVFQAIEGLKGKHGQEKEDAAIALQKSLVRVIEDSISKDILSDPLVEDATRGVYQAIAALDKVIDDVKAKKAAGKTALKDSESDK